MQKWCEAAIPNGKVQPCVEVIEACGEWFFRVDHQAAATMALREAIKGQDDPGKIVKAILALTRPAGAARP